MYENNDLYLICAGGGSFTESEKDKFYINNLDKEFYI